MTTRARAAAETRDRIVAAAHALLDRKERTGLTLAEVAKAAGVTRATIYKSVGSRQALLAAVFEDQGRRVKYERVRAASALPDVAKAVVETVRESCRAWGRTPDAIRKTLALAVVDEEIGALVARYERYRRMEIAALAERAFDAGVLGEDVTVEHAAAVLALHTSFTAFDGLRVERSATAATEHLVGSVKRALGLRMSAKGSG